MVRALPSRKGMRRSSYAFTFAAPGAPCACMEQAAQAPSPSLAQGLYAWGRGSPPNVSCWLMIGAAN